jgi:hypothetical protein
MMRASMALALLALATGAARADGLADLKAALARVGSATPLRAQVDARITRRLGEGKEAEEESGQASVTLDDSARGMAVSYSRPMVGRIEAELRAKGKNPNSKTPAMKALNELDAAQLLGLSSPAPALMRSIERSAFKGERVEAFQGKPARVLTFEAPISSLSDRERKFAKQFESVQQVWIGADGMPLASRTRVTISGRAFVVVSFEALHEDDTVFSTVGDRLLVSRRESFDKSSGAGEREERRVVTTLQVQP